MNADQKKKSAFRSVKRRPGLISGKVYCGRARVMVSEASTYQLQNFQQAWNNSFPKNV